MSISARRTDSKFVGAGIAIGVGVGAGIGVNGKDLAKRDNQCAAVTA